MGQVLISIDDRIRAVEEKTFKPLPYTVTLTRMDGFGLMGTNLKDVYVEFPLPFIMPMDATIAVTSLICIVRGVGGGNLDTVLSGGTSEVIGTSGFTVTPSLKNEGCVLELRIQKSTNFDSASSQIYDSPVFAFAPSMTVTFS